MTALQLIAVWAFGPRIEDADRAAVAKARSERVLALSPENAADCFGCSIPDNPKAAAQTAKKDYRNGNTEARTQAGPDRPL